MIETTEAIKHLVALAELLGRDFDSVLREALDEYFTRQRKLLPEDVQRMLR